MGTVNFELALRRSYLKLVEHYSVPTWCVLHNCLSFIYEG